MLDTGHDDTDGSLVTVNELRGLVQLVVLREQLADVLDTVITGGMLQVILGGLLQGQTTLFGIIDDGGHSVVAQNVLGLGGGILVENIVLNHFGFLLIVFVGFNVFRLRVHCSPNQGIHNVSLFLGHALDNVFYGFFVFRRSFFDFGRLFFFSHLGFLLFFSGMFKDIFELTAVVIDGIEVTVNNPGIRFLCAVSHNFLDMSTWIGPSQN